MRFSIADDNSQTTQHSGGSAYTLPGETSSPEMVSSSRGVEETEKAAGIHNGVASAAMMPLILGTNGLPILYCSGTVLRQTSSSEWDK